MAEKWNPRGPQTWPEWREATPGVTRVEHVRTGWCGTFVRWPRTPAGRNPGYAVIEWDESAAIGRVVAYAFDLRVAE